MTNLFQDEVALFPTDYKEIVQRIRRIEPIKYGKTRNFLKGAVTYLSPYISRGVISTKQVLAETLNRRIKPNQIEKFIQELAWRDYWQQIWIARGDAINVDLKNKQNPVRTTEVSQAIMEASTGIEAVDNAIQNLYQTGYMHNHLRMYIASIACNIAQSHWKQSAQWMYFHLLDADWASNALSWQWVAGANSNKKYYANQENINKYCDTKQNGTFLDVSYDAFYSLDVPKVLEPVTTLDLTTKLPESDSLFVDSKLPTLIYNFYNLDPNWKTNVLANRILLLEPSHFHQYPVSQKTIDFVLALSKNIKGIKVYV
ncbi:MAG: FAD-binding domain-containing protein [Bacteroidota bacterium]